MARRISLARSLVRASPYAAVVAVATGVLLAVRSHGDALTSELARARDLHGGRFAGAAACGRCHPDHLASWHRTFHRTMTQDVSASSPVGVVAGDFAGATYRYGGVTARMHRDQSGRYLMTFSSDGHGGDGPDPIEAVVVRAVGSRRYQQYLTEVDGVLWRLPLAFHIEERRWFHMNGAFLTPDPAVLAPAGQTAARPEVEVSSAAIRPRFGGGEFDRHVARWNDNCVFCHNVAPNPGLDAASGTFRTTVAELGVACEACHGPGDEHAALNGDPMRRYALHLAAAPTDPTIVNPSRLSPGRAADLCGRCHGQRLSDDLAPILAHGDPFVPGDDLALYSSPLWRDTPLGKDGEAFAARFWDDGTPRLTAYEYQGLLLSACAMRGPLTCTTCHGMHDGRPEGQLRPTAEGDGACIGCHTTLASPASAARHSHHQATGPGGRCVSCHMPRIVYGVLDIHVSHRIENPDPARASREGRPDACTLCHVESDPAWAAREVARLWPRARPGRGAEADDSMTPRDALFGGDPVMRAVAADALGRAPLFVNTSLPDRTDAWNLRADALLRAMDGDRYPAVRHLAARALERLVLAAGEGPRRAASVPGAGSALPLTPAPAPAPAPARAPAPAPAHFVGGAATAALVRAFDATSTPEDRGRVLASVRRALALPDRPDDAGRIAALRAAARLADIDIGE